MKTHLISFVVSMLAVLGSGIAYIQANYYDKEDVNNKFQLIEYKIREVKN